jgi:hypothetical protein
MQKLLGPTLGRLQNDLLNPIVSRAFRILLREGVIEEPPEEIVEKQAQFDIEYIGALSRAQKSDRAASIERFVVSVGNLAPVMPGVLDVVDEQEVVRQLGRDLGVPPEIVRSEDESLALKDERDQLAADRIAAETAAQQAQADQLAPQLEGEPAI